MTSFVESDAVNQVMQLERLRECSGGSIAIPTPFGSRPLVYADFTASGRYLPALEDTLSRCVAPLYANTHSETSYTGRQTTLLRQQARDTVRTAVGAEERHAVVFAGSGATGGLAKLGTALRRWLTGDAVVFVGPYEHHSNDLLWRESGARVERIPLDSAGAVDVAALEAALARNNEAPFKLGAFSAASNVTGIKSDMRHLAKLLHEHGAWFLADYAAAAPYMAMDMSPSTPGADDHIDALVFSPHKFLGGPGASGVLVADRTLLDTPVPTHPGGGTVAYVTGTKHRYVADIERREEAGTPNILGDIRAGLVCQLKADIGVDTIHAHEEWTKERALSRWKMEPGISILGPQSGERLAIFSLEIESKGKRLHPALVVTLLNDLFGIQARAGCSCAGPYAHDLLEIDGNRAAIFDDLVAHGYGMMRPGWTRLGFHILHDAATVDYVIAAVCFIARRGADFLSLYIPDFTSGQWHHPSGQQPPVVEFESLCGAWRDRAQPRVQGTSPSYNEVLEEAERAASAAHQASSPSKQVPADVSEDLWFAV